MPCVKSSHGARRLYLCQKAPYRNIFLQISQFCGSSLFAFELVEKSRVQASIRLKSQAIHCAIYGYPGKILSPGKKNAGWAYSWIPTIVHDLKKAHNKAAVARILFAHYTRTMPRVKVRVPKPSFVMISMTQRARGLGGTASYVMNQGFRTRSIPRMRFAAAFRGSWSFCVDG